MKRNPLCILACCAWLGTALIAPQVRAAVVTDNNLITTNLGNLTASGAVSWFGFAQAIFAEARGGFGNGIPRIVPVPTSEYPAAARRPLNSRLDNSRFVRTFGLEPPTWAAMLEACMRDMRKETAVGE